MARISNYSLFEPFIPGSESSTPVNENAREQKLGGTFACWCFCFCGALAASNFTS